MKTIIWKEIVRGRKQGKYLVRCFFSLAVCATCTQNFGSR